MRNDLAAFLLCFFPGNIGWMSDRWQTTLACLILLSIINYFISHLNKGNLCIRHATQLGIAWRHFFQAGCIGRLWRSYLHDSPADNASPPLCSTHDSWRDNIILFLAYELCIGDVWTPRALFSKQCLIRRACDFISIGRSWKCSNTRIYGKIT